MEKDKRYYRNLKRNIKKLGNKRLRSYLKRRLFDDSLDDDFDYGDLSSKRYNGMDQDRTRRREAYEESFGRDPNEDERESF